MSEYIVSVFDEEAELFIARFGIGGTKMFGHQLVGEIVRCRDCKWLNVPDWDNTLAMIYGEPPTTCDLLSHNEWRMDGDRRVAETTFLEVEPDNYCSFGERKVDA